MPYKEPPLEHRWKKGQSGNAEGRPKGKTMKEYAKELLAVQTEEERQEFLAGIDKRVIWEMAEGKAKQDIEANVKGELKIEISEDIAKKYNDSTQQPKESSTE